MRTLLGATTWAALTLSGCTDNWMVRAREQAILDEQQSLATLHQRARFELQCPDAQLHILERYQDGPATLVGVNGCGRQVMYKRRLRRRHGQGRTTDNTKWEPAAPSPAFGFSAPPMAPLQAQPSAAPPLPLDAASPPAPSAAPAPTRRIGSSSNR